MQDSALNSEEIAQRGKDIYQNYLRVAVETPDNIGKIIAVDIDTREYEIDQDLLVACQRLKTKQPNTVTWAERIGYDAVYAIDGTLIRTTT